MNKYIIPVCDINKSKVYNLTIMATSYSDCEDKIIEKFSKYSESDDYDEFLDDLDKNDILIGQITDIEEL
jgi:hypothetical protein